MLYYRYKRRLVCLTMKRWVSQKVSWKLREGKMEKFADEMFLMILLASVTAFALYAYEGVPVHTAPIATGMNPD